MPTRQTAPVVAGWISLISNLLLTVMKITVGSMFGSRALVADGIHNGADVMASIASVGSMRVSNMPADEEHPYGHGKAEVLASGVVGILLGISAIFILYQGIHSLFLPPGSVHVLPLVASAASLVWKQTLYVYTIRIGKQYRSRGLIATAYDHLSDVYASLATLIGIGIGIVGRYLHIPNLAYADPIAGIVVSIFIGILAIRMEKDAIDVLMEKAVSQERLVEFEKIILTIPEVKRIDRLRARELGHYVLVDVRLSIPAELTIQQGHDISREIKSTIMNAHHEVQEVLIHFNPWYESER